MTPDLHNAILIKYKQSEYRQTEKATVSVFTDLILTDQNTPHYPIILDIMCDTHFDYLKRFYQVGQYIKNGHLSNGSQINLSLKRPPIYNPYKYDRVEERCDFAQGKKLFDYSTEGYQNEPIIYHDGEAADVSDLKVCKISGKITVLDIKSIIIDNTENFGISLHRMENNSSILHAHAGEEIIKTETPHSKLFEELE